MLATEAEAISVSLETKFPPTHRCVRCFVHRWCVIDACDLYICIRALVLARLHGRKMTGWAKSTVQCLPCENDLCCKQNFMHGKRIHFNDDYLADNLNAAVYCW